MIKFFNVVAIYVIFTSVNAFAEDNIPRVDFIRYTEGSIKALEALDVGFLNFRLNKNDADRLITNYNISLKEFENYGDWVEWDKRSLQYNIIYKLFHFSVDLSLSIQEIKYNNSTFNSIEPKIKRINIEVNDKLLDYKNLDK